MKILSCFFYKYGYLNTGKFMEINVKYVEGRVNHIILLNNMTYNDLIFKKKYGVCRKRPAELHRLPDAASINEKLSEESNKDGKDPDLIKSSTTPDTGYQWESNKLAIRHRKREPRGQPFPTR